MNLGTSVPHPAPEEVWLKSTFWVIRTSLGDREIEELLFLAKEGVIKLEQSYARVTASAILQH